MVVHQHVQDGVRPLAAVKDVPHDVQMVHRQPLNQAGQGNDEVVSLLELEQGVDDLLVVEQLVVVLVALGMQQLVQDVAVGRRHRLAHLGAGVFGGKQLCQVDQALQHKAVPLLAAAPLLPDLFELFLRVVDQCAQAGTLHRGQRLGKQYVHLFPDDAGGIVEDVLEGLIFPVQIAHKVLGAFGQIEDCLQVDDFGADLLPGRIFFRQQAQEFDAVAYHVHGTPPFFYSLLLGQKYIKFSPSAASDCLLKNSETVSAQTWCREVVTRIPTNPIRELGAGSACLFSF